MTVKKETKTIKERDNIINDEDNPHKKKKYTEEEKQFKRQTLIKARARRSDIASIRKFEKDEKKWVVTRMQRIPKKSQKNCYDIFRDFFMKNNRIL